MSVWAVHATASRLVEAILRDGLKPGRNICHYLAGGVYLYLGPGEGGDEAASSSALAVAKKKYGSGLACLVAEVNVERALNLQHPKIHCSLRTFWTVLARRLRKLPILLEGNNDSAGYRPQSHLTIELFWHCLEALSGCEIDVLSARFPEPNQYVDRILPPEIAVKRSRAILSVKRQEDSDAVAIKTSADPLQWSCPRAILDAARQAPSFVEGLELKDLMDLIVCGHQSADAYWTGPTARFTPRSEVRLIYEKSDDLAWHNVVRGMERIRPVRGQRIYPIDLRSVVEESRSVPEALAQRQRAMRDAGGLIVCLGAKGGRETVAALLQALSAASVPPILLLLECGSDLPLDVRAHHNVTCANTSISQLDPAIAALVEGYLSDGWVDAALVVRLGMAARHGSDETRRRDARRIVEAYRERKNLLV